jgi:hypothetical protein
MEAGKPRGSTVPEPGRCGRRLKNTEPPRYCLRFPVEGRDCCPFHGGRTLRGPEHPNYKTGQHSRYSFKGALAKHLDDTQREQDLLDRRPDLEALTALAKEAAERVGTGESGKLWLELRTKANEAKAARRRPDGAQDYMELCDEMIAMIERGSSDEQAKAEFRSVQRDCQQAARLEWQRQIDMCEVLTKERMWLFLKATAEVLIVLRDDREMAVEVVKGARVDVSPEKAARIAAEWHKRLHKKYLLLLGSSRGQGEF